MTRRRSTTSQTIPKSTATKELTNRRPTSTERQREPTARRWRHYRKDSLLPASIESRLQSRNNPRCCCRLVEESDSQRRPTTMPRFRLLRLKALSLPVLSRRAVLSINPSSSSLKGCARPRQKRRLTMQSRCYRLHCRRRKTFRCCTAPAAASKVVQVQVFG